MQYISKGSGDAVYSEWFYPQSLSMHEFTEGEKSAGRYLMCLEMTGCFYVACDLINNKEEMDLQPFLSDICRVIQFPWLYSTAAPWLLHSLKLLNKKNDFDFLNDETSPLRFFVVLFHRSLSVSQRIAMVTMHRLCLALVCMVCPHFHLKGLFAFTISALNPLQPVIHISHGSFSLSPAVFTLHLCFMLPLMNHGEVLIPILEVSDPYWKVCGASHSICPVGNTN